MEKTVTKTFTAIIEKADKETGIVDVLIPLSTESVDREGESIIPSAFKKRLKSFKKHPILLSSHDYRDLQKQIGEWTSISVTDEGLKGKPQYYINMGNAEADWGFFLASIGMASYSVGFIPFSWDDDTEADGDKKARRVYTDVELLEVSHVVVPANRDAAQSMRSTLANKGVETPEAYLSMLEAVTEAKTELTKIAEDNGITIISELNDVITKPEETDDYIRIPVPAEEGKHDGHRIRTITISEKKGIKALYCGEDKVVITYMFDKDMDWTMESAQEWCDEHAGKAFEPHQISQAELRDELDYCIGIIEKVGISVEVKDIAESLVSTIKRITGGDIPVEDKEVVQEPEEQPNKAEILSVLDELYKQYRVKK